MTDDEALMTKKNAKFKSQSFDFHSGLTLSEVEWVKLQNDPPAIACGSGQPACQRLLRSYGGQVAGRQSKTQKV